MQLTVLLCCLLVSELHLPNFPAMKGAETLSAITSAKPASYPQQEGSQFRCTNWKRIETFYQANTYEQWIAKTIKQKGQNNVKKLNTTGKQQCKVDKQDVRVTLQHNLNRYDQFNNGVSMCEDTNEIPVANDMCYLVQVGLYHISLWYIGKCGFFTRFQTEIKPRFQIYHPVYFSHTIEPAN